MNTSRTFFIVELCWFVFLCQEPLNSGDDVSDEEDNELFDTENVVVCQYDKVRDYLSCYRVARPNSYGTGPRLSVNLHIMNGDFTLWYVECGTVKSHSSESILFVRLVVCHPHFFHAGGILRMATGHRQTNSY